jgi:hypothetical protein
MSERAHTDFFNDRESQMPRHPSEEIKNGTLQGILKQLGIENLSTTKLSSNPPKKADSSSLSLTSNSA